MRVRLTISIAVALAPLALASCGVFSNPQTTPGGPNIPPSADEGIVITLRHFDPYAQKQVDMRLVGGDGTVLMVSRRAKLGSGDYRLELLSVPHKPDSRVDVLVDMDGDGVFEPESEPAWSAPVGSTNSVTFDGSQTPNGAVQPDKPGGDFVIHFTGFAGLQGQLLRLALINPARQTTALYTGTVQGDEFSVRIPQVVVETEPYTIDIFADANGNGHYDTPPTDAAWFAYATGDASGINLVFPYNEDFEDVDFEQ